jgi:hypothetical protein
MSNEKMREEFEVWSANHEYLGGTGLFMVDDRYKDIDVQHAWESWRDSRAAIEVEWPDHYEYTNSDVAGAAILDCITAFQKAVRA